MHEVNILTLMSHDSVKTGPSFADAAVGRIAQGTKVLAEGGYEKIFRQSFETVPEEQLLKTYACYLSTSAGPVMGVLYYSTAKLAFCSDSPLSYKVGEETQWSYYKVTSHYLPFTIRYYLLMFPATGAINAFFGNMVDFIFLVQEIDVIKYFPC